MKVINEGSEVNLKFIFGHVSYRMICPLCLDESEHQCAVYPKIIKCPYCKTQLQIKYSERRSGLLNCE